MNKSLPRTSGEVTDIYRRHVGTVYRICFSYMKNAFEAEDAVHDTFMKMITSGPAFESVEHEKAWLLRTAINICKNMLNHWRRKIENIDEHPGIEAPGIAVDETYQAICTLPTKYKTVILLYYYEGYSSAEIAKMLKRPQSTVTNYMSEARKILRKKLGGENQ